jgi:hypothetical protein
MYKRNGIKMKLAEQVLSLFGEIEEQAPKLKSSPSQDASNAKRWKDKIADTNKELERLEQKKRAIANGIELNISNLEKAKESGKANLVKGYEDSLAKDRKEKKEVQDLINRVKQDKEKYRSEIKKIKKGLGE